MSEVREYPHNGCFDRVNLSSGFSDFSITVDELGFVDA